ncbi:hypothetical protein BJY01DRAFT_171660 [Aspergillus pseudoustus]|uniref:RING-type domain-containing protein n=1 Tax=Aspergillus pseudoustus TaxID=1810923 RepID=A0ABR4KWL2_9EURO
MPSQAHQTQATAAYLPHLSDILELHPERETNCAGFAVSKGRRCRLPTNAHGRRIALSLLDKGTANIHAGLCIDDILEDLAPHVLCTGWHQYQAWELISTWQGRVDRYLASAPAPRSTSRHSSQNRYEGWSVEDCLAELERLLAETAAESVVASRSSARATGRNSRLTNDLNLNTDSGSTVRTTSRTVQQQPGTSATTTTHQRPGSSISADSPLFRQAAATPISSRSPAATPIAINASSSRPSSNAVSILSRTSPASVVRPREVTRRSVGGCCSICQDELRKSRTPIIEPVGPNAGGARGDDDEEKEESEDGAGETGDDLEVEESETADEEEELSWCKAQCGVNYHKKCIDEWLAKAPHPTCPSCRRAWKY